MLLWTNKAKKNCSVPSAYMKIINKFPDLLKPKFKKELPRHQVVHEIDTASHAPCTAKVRPLLKNSPKAIKGYARWMELDKLGVIEKLKPDEPVFYWMSCFCQQKRYVVYERHLSR